MKSLPFALALLPFLVATPVASAATWGEFTREELFSTHLEEAPGADAVVLLDHGAARVDHKFRLKFTRHRRVKIFTEAGAAQNVMRIPYAEGTELKKFRAHTFLPPDKKEKVKGDHVRDEETPDGMVRIVTFPKVQPGAILEVSYELRRKELDVVDPWFFQSEHFTRESRFDLQLPKGLAHRALHGGLVGPAPKPVIDQINDPEKAERRLWQTTWTARDVPAHAPQPLTPNPADHRKTLYVQLESFKSPQKSFAIEQPWADLGATVAARYDEAWRENARAGAWAGASVDGIRNPEGKARALYLRVRDGIRSEAPADPSVDAVPVLSEVLVAEAGSPLAKNLVLTQLLRTRGIDASPVLIATRDRGTLLTGWHAMSQLNHAIVAVHLGTGTVFVDASVPSCPFGVLPPASAVEEGLMIGRAGCEIVEVTAQPVESARQVVTSAELDGRGDLVATSTWTLTGYPAFEARREIAGTDARSLVERIVGARFPGSEIVSTGVTGELDDDAPLVVETTFRAPGWATKQGYDLSCGAPFVFACGDNPLGAEERTVPVTYDYAWTCEESLSLRVPKGLYVPSAPAEANARTREVTFSMRFDAKGTTLEGKRRFRIREPVVERVAVPALQDLYGQVAMADRATFTVKRQPMRTSSESSTH